MLGRITERKIAQLFYTIGARELEIERTREILCQNFDFELYTAFRFFDVDVKGSVSALDLRDFLRRHHVDYEISIIQILIAQYDSNLDGRLSIQEFSSFVLPSTNLILKDAVSLRTPYSTLTLETQLVMLRLLEQELRLQQDVENLRCEITVQVDFGLLDSFRVLDILKSSAIDRASIRSLLSRHNLHLSESELDGVFRRLDCDDDRVLNYIEYVDSIMPKRGRSLSPNKSTFYNPSPNKPTPYSTLSSFPRPTSPNRNSSPLRQPSPSKYQMPLQSSPSRSFNYSPSKQHESPSRLTSNYSIYRQSPVRTLSCYDMSPSRTSPLRSPPRNTSPLRNASPLRSSPSRTVNGSPSRSQYIHSSPRRSYLESSPSRSIPLRNSRLSPGKSVTFSPSRRVDIAPSSDLRTSPERSRVDLIPQRLNSPLKSMPLRNTPLREAAYTTPNKAPRY